MGKRTQRDRVESSTYVKELMSGKKPMPQIREGEIRDIIYVEYNPEGEILDVKQYTLGSEETVRKAKSLLGKEEGAKVVLLSAYLEPFAEYVRVNGEAVLGIPRG